MGVVILSFELKNTKRKKKVKNKKEIIKMTRRTINWGAITEKMANMDKKGGNYNEADLNLYNPKVKEDGTYDAIIRFVPSPDTDLPFVLVYNHGFQGSNGKWYVENCPKTHNKKCPACERATKLWNEGEETKARTRFKKFSAYSNILVVKDPQNPDNEGKVFIYRYGKKLYELIKSKMVPSNEIDEPVMVFDYDTGANFKLKIRSKAAEVNGKKKTFPNYDSSEFMQSSKLDDKTVDMVEASLHPLKPYIADEKFSSYESLAQKINEVEELGFEAPVSKAPAKAASKPAVEVESEDEDETASFFKRLKGEE